ncbi:glycosyltransferase family 2 protein [Acetomicrobium sp. S15 = DSM 107314]|uniref:glycosyltransferase family 2 protein n=1 Tax=Acetomicrobium sp. S15 = DSM 107314 TaxID=2529858 RepID=UPI00315927E4
MQENKNTKSKDPTSGLLSLVVPVYNASSFLQKTLHSLEDQDYAPIELILVDDGSQDESLDIMREFAKQSKCIVKVLSQKNMGVSVARNRGLLMAEGEYVAFCDNDDLFARDCFSKLVSALEEFNADMAFCGHDLIDVNDKTVRKYDEKFVYPKKNPESGEEVLTQYPLGKISIWGGAVLYRRAYLLENGIFYTQNCYCAEDNEVFVKALGLARRVACVRQSLSFWRRHPFSASYSSELFKTYSNLHELAAYLRCRAFLENNGKQNTRAYKILSSLIIPAAYAGYLQKLLLAKGDDYFKKLIRKESLKRQLRKGNNITLLSRRPDQYFKLLLAMHFPAVC